MEKAPKIGDRVNFKGNLVVSPCAGTIEKIHPRRAWLADDDDPRWEDPDFVCPRGGLLPESEWQVTLKVDAIPKEWPYRNRDGQPNNDKFCPSVSELEKAQDAPA